MSTSLPALSIQPIQQPNILAQIQKMQSIKSMLLGQQQSAANLQGTQLDNASREQSLAAQKQVVAAQHDPEWNPADPDTTVKVLNRYNVPIQVQGTVMKGILETQSMLRGASSQALEAAAAAHTYMDDQIQAAKNAPEDVRQKTYQTALQNIAQYGQQLPAGPGRQQFMQEISQAPPLYDQQFVDREHAVLRTSASLTKDALEKAQTNEAQNKANQAQQEGNLAFAKIPGAQAESAIQQQQSNLTPQKRALAGNLFYDAGGGDPQAKNALALETSQKIAAAQAGVAGAPSALRGVAPHLVQAATAAFDKAGQNYATAYQSAQNMSDFLQQARSGNKEAVRIVPLQGALEITTAQGVHRINRTEVDQYAGAGNLYDKLAGALGGAVSGKNITDSVLNDMDALQQTVSRNAKSLHANKVATINQSYGSKFEPMDFSKTGTAGEQTTGHVIQISGKQYRYNGSGDTADLKNYSQVSQ